MKIQLKDKQKSSLEKFTQVYYSYNIEFGGILEVLKQKIIET